MDPFLFDNEGTGHRYSEFGGVVIGQSAVLTPTGQTAIFLFADQDITQISTVYKVLDPESKLAKFNLVRLGDVSVGTPPMSGILYPTEECLYRVFNKGEYAPKYSNSFTAQLLNTKLSWDDLVLPYDTYEALHELDIWLSHHKALEQFPELIRKFKRGYRALFHGPSGTGKTLTASLLCKKYGRDVYHVDLAMTVSKYIGETEKTLRTFLILLNTKTGYCSSMKQMHCSANVPRAIARMIDMLTKR